MNIVKHQHGLKIQDFKGNKKKVTWFLGIFMSLFITLVSFEFYAIKYEFGETST